MFKKWILLSFFLAFGLWSCKNGNDNPAGPGGAAALKVETREGTLSVPPEANIAPDELQVITFAEGQDMKADGSFRVKANVANTFQLLMFTKKSTGAPIFIGIYDPTEKSVMADLTSTALALTLFNPYLILSDQTNRAAYLNAVKLQEKFAELKTALRNAYSENPDAALDFEKNPVIMQLAVQAMQQAMESLGNGGANKMFKENEAQELEPPYIQDVAGAGINFVNPRFVWYAAGIYPNDGDLKEVVTVQRKERILEFNWGWPPVVNGEPAQTPYNLGDGSFRIYMTRGLNFAKFTQWDDPEGRATICNSAQLVVYLMELVIGNLDFFNKDLLLSFPNHFHVNGEQSYEIGEAIGAKDLGQIITTIAKIVGDNLDGLSYWIWQQTASNAQKAFLDNAFTFFSNSTQVLKILGYLNEQVPFISDLIFSPREINYYITQRNGVVSDQTENNAPEAEFSITPPAGIVDVNFVFNASATTDDHDALGDLMFRWDFDGDGYWDTGWSSDTTATHQYETSGSYRVVLEAKDSEGLTGVAVHTLNVGGGQGTATHVKLFRDVLPWSSNSMVTMLESLGFTEGQGPNTYEIIGSESMATVDLIPGQDLVIISNDQNQTFYDNYAAVQVRFSNFVMGGGALFWEACDNGWSGGSMADAGIVLPGNIQMHYALDYWNYIPNPDLPLVSGLPTAMDHNYASHESFTNLPDGTIVYCVNSEQEPTLIEFNLGAGWVVVTGQPLEHQYEHIYGNPDMENLLPRIVSYFTGKPLSKPLAKPRLAPSRRATSGN